LHSAAEATPVVREDNDAIDTEGLGENARTGVGASGIDADDGIGMT